jgi:hypothetical protein
MRQHLHKKTNPSLSFFYNSLGQGKRWLLLAPFLYHKIHNGIAMSKVEHPEKHGWWLNELESLGINTREESQLKDFKKTSELTTDIKQIFYEEYQKAFNEDL